jgi:hypothetical protein
MLRRGNLLLPLFPKYQAIKLLLRNGATVPRTVLFARLTLDCVAQMPAVLNLDHSVVLTLAAIDDKYFLCNNKWRTNFSLVYQLSKTLVRLPP